MTPSPTIWAGTPRARWRRPVPRAASEHPAPPRLHELDALRVTAMFLVVVLHAALGYTRIEIPRLLWAVRDPASHLGFDIFCWWAMGVSLPLFFTISGFFAADLYATRGPVGFLRNRAARIGAPTLVASLVILPASFVAWASGWLISGRCTLREVRRMKFHAPGIQPALYGPAHLWFLEYLIGMLLAYWALRGLWSLRQREPGGPGPAVWLLSSPWRPLFLAIPTTIILWISRERVGLDAVLDRHNSFLIDPIRLIHHALFFAVGVGLHAFRDNLGRTLSHGTTYLALSLPVFACRAWLLRRDWSHRLDNASGLVLVTLGALFAWLTVFGFLGVYQRYVNHPRSAVRYLADSSFWVYLCHFPIVGLAQADLLRLPLPTALKFIIVLATTLALGLSTYQVMVRYTFLGNWLHGRRDRPQPESHIGRPI